MHTKSHGLSDAANHEPTTLSALSALLDMSLADQVPNGLVDPTKFTVSYDPASRVFTVAGATGAAVFLGGTRFDKAGTVQTTAHADTSGLWFLYYAGAGATLTVSSTAWDIFTTAQLSMVLYDASTQKAIMLEERHPSNTEGHPGMSNLDHWYNHLTRGTQVIDGMVVSGTAPAPVWSCNGGSIVDEDIPFTVPALASGGPYRILYRSGADASSQWSWSDTSENGFLDNTENPVYNQLSGPNWVLTPITDNNRWFNVWVLGIPSMKLDGTEPEFATIGILGQRVHTSLAAAQSEDPATGIAWANSMFPEFVDVARVTYRRVQGGASANTNLVEIVQLRSNRIQVAGVSPSVHSALSGRDAANSHPSYAISAEDVPAYGTLSPNSPYYQKGNLRDLANSLIGTGQEKVEAATTGKVYLASQVFPADDPSFPVGDFEASLDYLLSTSYSDYAPVLDFSDFDEVSADVGWELTTTKTLRKGITLLLPCVHIEYTGTGNMFEIGGPNVSIIGRGRSGNSTADAEARTRFTMSSGKYHVYGRGCDGLKLQGLDLIGVKSTEGLDYPDLDGSGGIWLEKPDPGSTGSGNTIRGIDISDVFVHATYGHGLFIDTPITSRLTNVRVSEAAGHAFFVKGGTSLTLSQCYAASSYLAGFCLHQTTYVSIFNCAAEYGGVGYWMRSAQAINLFACGAESNTNRGSTAVPLNVQTTDALGDPVVIQDIPSDYVSYFRGHSYMFTGGGQYLMNACYSTNPGRPHPTAGGTVNTRHILFKDAVTSSSIINPRLNIASGDTSYGRFDTEFTKLGAGVSPKGIRMDANPLAFPTAPVGSSKIIETTNSAGYGGPVLVSTDADLRLVDGQTEYSLVTRPVDTTNFGKNLSSTEDTVQKALDKLDDMDTGHEILDEAGDAVIQRAKLQFEGLAVTDDAVNGITKVSVVEKPVHEFTSADVAGGILTLSGTKKISEVLDSTDTHLLVNWRYDYANDQTLVYLTGLTLVGTSKVVFAETALGGGASGGMWTLVERKVFDAAATSYTFSGLNGGTDIRYQLVGVIVDAGGAGIIGVRPNNDSGSNYEYRYYGDGTGTATADKMTLAFTTNSSGSSSYFEATIFAKKPNRSAISRNLRSNTASYMLHSQWTNTADEITSLVVMATATNDIGIGSYIELWRLAQ